MASQPELNGSASGASNTMTAAQRLQEKHQADTSHHAVVEDVVDEEDIEHPPPSMNTAKDPAPEVTPPSAPRHDELSEKAAGKRKVESDPVADSTGVSGKPTLNTASEEAFPALGSRPRTTVPPPSMAWGARKPQTAQAGVNGANGHPNMPSMVSSRASTPTSGAATPPSTNTSSIAPQQGISLPQHMPLPGRHKERIQFAPSQLLPRNQLKKPLPDVLRSINKTSKAKVEMKTGPNGNIIFEGSGPVDATRQALKDLAREIGSKQQVKVPVPLSARPHIIGRAGAVIQGIAKRTGARVQMPKTEDVPAVVDEDDDSRTIDVSIEGDAVAAEMARREIESIIGERTSTVNLRMRDVPPELFPFLAGPRNSRVATLEDGRSVQVHIPQYHTWTGQPPPPPPSSGMPPDFVPSQHHHIRISGDRFAAQEVKAEIERQIQDLRRQITLSQVPIDRNRHQFILENDNSLHDLLEETGCSIIMPPANEDSELLTVTGPHDRIETGLEKIMDLASAMQSSRVDVSRQHPGAAVDPQAHARALGRYLRQRRALEELERQHNARVVLPPPNQPSPDWELYFREGRNGIRARQAILNLINAHPPQRVRHVEMDPFFHNHVHQHAASLVQDQFGVHLVAPEETDPLQHLVLVYEGPPTPDIRNYQFPTQRPSQQDLAEFERNLQQAQEHLLGLIQGQHTVSSKLIEVPTKYHEKVKKFVRREQEGLPPTEIPVQIRFGSEAALNGSIYPGTAPPHPAGSEPEGQLRGPNLAVESLAERIAAFVEAEKRDELERSHITTFDFPQKFANFLIGKRGENINKYREEFDVDIQVKDGKVTITGPPAKAEAAKAKITTLGKKLEDESTHVLKIESRFHKDLVGPRWSQINHLQDRYKVRVQFPRMADDKSVADDISEADSNPRSRRSNQGPDEVIIRGPSKGADSAREELLNLLQWTKDNSHSASVSVAQRQLPSLIGQGGQELESIQLTTGAKIDIPGRDTADASGRVQVQLKGTKKQVEEAKKVIEQKAKVFDDSTVRTIEIDRKYHSAIIGTGGSNIRNIVVAAGGSDDRRDLARTVRFPRQDSSDNAIRVEGNKALVDKIVSAIESYASQREGQTTEVVEVPPEKHRVLIGRGGESRRTIESQFGIGLDIPKLSQQGPERSQVKISGQPADIERARAHILELTREQEGETIDVPRKYHHAISDNGAFFRRLRNDLKVTIDHGGQQPPPKSSGASRASSNANASMPLITDDNPSSHPHSWELLEPTASPERTAEAEEGSIPWIIRAPNADSVASACAAIDRALDAAQTQENQCTGLLVLPDPRTYRFIIGQGGSQINAIRRQTGCRITVPRDQTPGSTIEIVGTKEGAEEARDVILELVKGGRRD